MQHSHACGSTCQAVTDHVSPDQFYRYNPVGDKDLGDIVLSVPFVTEWCLGSGVHRPLLKDIFGAVVTVLHRRTRLFVAGVDFDQRVPEVCSVQQLLRSVCGAMTSSMHLRCVVMDLRADLASCSYTDSAT